jgi:hypothetical protein
MKPIPYFEKDGSYNEYIPRRRKPRIDDSFRLDFATRVTPQVANKMDPQQALEIVRCVDAYRTLRDAGCLPGNRYLQIQRQINLKADRYVRKFKKNQTPT